MPSHPPTDPLTPHRPLPRPVPPVPAETLDSYLRRLAVANRLDPDALRAHLTRDTRRRARVPLDALARVSGQRPTALRHALPELDPTRLRPTLRGPRPHGTVRRRCRSCTRARGHREDAWCWSDDHDVICLRHLRWTGDGHDWVLGEAQPDLRRQPDILAAHRRHHRLIRRHGHDATTAAFQKARHICHQWHRRGDHEQDLRRLMSLFHGPTWRVLAADSTVQAASYPQIVALTRLLVSPFWRAKAYQDWPEPVEFLCELRRTVAPDYHWTIHRSYGAYEPLVELIIDERESTRKPGHK